MTELQQKAQRARGLARQATEDRQRTEHTLEVLKHKERQLCLEALLAEEALMIEHQAHVTDRLLKVMGV